jgi:hypothetical protein
LEKHAIAIELLPDEHDEHLQTALPSDDWYRYLFEELTREPFERNALRVITFNFDRSFERALFLKLKNKYGLGDVDVSTLVHRLQTIHFHGDLGEPNWLVDSSGPREGSRGYSCDSHIPDREIIRWCANRIRLGSEGAIETAKEDAHELLKWARRVCFIGFGYDERSLERVDVAELTEGKAVFGTVRGIPTGRLGRIKAAFPKNNIKLLDKSALEFLQTTGLIHE